MTHGMIAGIGCMRLYLPSRRTHTTVDMTHTLGQPSGLIAEGLGFMYNGAMAVFDPRPGHGPGTRQVTLLPIPDDCLQEPFLVLGAPGATDITMGNLQVMLNVIDFGMNAEAAVNVPRAHAAQLPRPAARATLHLRLGESLTE